VKLVIPDDPAWESSIGGIRSAAWSTDRLAICWRWQVEVGDDFEHGNAPNLEAARLSAVLAAGRLAVQKRRSITDRQR